VHQDEVLAMRLLAEHNQILEGRIKALNGNVIKTIGDAFLADFDSVFSAVNCAVAIQEDLAERNTVNEEKIEVRIGIHVGDVIYRENDVFGDGVNVASRIESEAGPGQIFVSSDIFSITYGKVDYKFKDLSSRDLKNIDRPVHLYEILWDPARIGEASKSTPVVPRLKKSRSKLVYLGVAAAVVLVSLVFFKQPTDTTERPTLAVVTFADETDDERLGRVRVGKVIGDAVMQKFYEFPYVQLVSPLQIMKVKKELGLEDHTVARDLSLAEEVAKGANGRFLVSGTLTKLGNQFVLSANLNDIENEKLLSAIQLKGLTEASILGSLVDSLCHRFQRKLIAELQIQETTPHEIVSVGELTTTSLEAYSQFLQGFELYQSGVFHPGIEMMIRATEIDTNFALAYSVIACAYSFSKEHEASEVYRLKSLKYKHRFSGISKESLIYKGNLAWFDEDYDACEKNYRLITELYPDDREGYYYYGLYFAYLKQDHKKAIELFERARDLSPEYYPTYRDMAYSIKALNGVEAAITLLQEYIRAHADGPGVDYARKTIAELRGVATE
jgi:adenylate cyclase